MGNWVSSKCDAFILEKAIEYGIFEKVVENAGANFNCEICENGYFSYGNSPLNLAAKSGNLEIVKYLSDKNSDVNSNGDGPLNISVIFDNKSVFKFLFEKFGESNFEVPNFSGESFVDLIKKYSRKNIKIIVMESFLLKNEFSNLQKEFLKENLID